MFLIRDVFKLDISKEIKELQDSNILIIEINFGVLKFDKFREINELQKRNIKLKSVADWVLKLDKSI